MIIIDYKDTRPIYEQVVERFKALILKGIMQPDEQLPSVRNLAMELSINPNTIQKAYAELERQERAKAQEAIEAERRGHGKAQELAAAERQQHEEERKHLEERVKQLEKQIQEK